MTTAAEALISVPMTSRSTFINQQKKQRRIRKGNNVGPDVMGNLQVGQHPAKDLGRTDDEHDQRGTDDRFEDDFREILDLEFLVDEQTHEDSVDGGHCRGLGGCEYPAVDAPDDDDRSHQRPEGFLEGDKQSCGGKGPFGRDALFLGNGPADDAHAESHEQAGNNAAHKEIANGRSGNDAEDDQGDGGAE